MQNNVSNITAPLVFVYTKDSVKYCTDTRSRHFQSLLWTKSEEAFVCKRVDSRETGSLFSQVNPYRLWFEEELPLFDNFKLWGVLIILYKILSRQITKETLLNKRIKFFLIISNTFYY